MIIFATNNKYNILMDNNKLSCNFISIINMLIVLLFCLFPMRVFSQSIENAFMMDVQKNEAGYQKYVGKRIQFRKPIGKYEDQSIVPESNVGIDYIITSISARVAYDFGGSENLKVTIEFKEIEGKKKVKIAAYNELHISTNLFSTKDFPIINYIPLIFMDEYESAKKENIGRILEHNLVKEKFIIEDIVFGDSKLKNGEVFGSSKFKIKSTLDGKIYYCHTNSAIRECFIHAFKGHYEGVLTQVEKPEDTTDRYGKTEKVDENGVSKYSYKDDIIEMIIYAMNDGFDFSIKNVSSSSIKIIWDEAVYVNSGGNTSKIMHKGVRYSEKDDSQTPTTIIKGAKLNDIAIPTSNVYYSEADKEWKNGSILPYDKIKKFGPVQLMLPIQVKDVVNEYIFEFEFNYILDNPDLLIDNLEDNTVFEIK